jgi:hypothetical protein
MRFWCSEITICRSRVTVFQSAAYPCSMHKESALTPYDNRRIAVEATRDPRTVRRVLAGAGAPMARLTVLAAAQRLGYNIAGAV